MNHPVTNCESCGKDKGIGRTLVRLCMACQYADLAARTDPFQDEKDATIAELRAEVERLNSELTQLREDRRVLAREARSTRERIAAINESNDPKTCGWAAIARTDARILAAVEEMQAAMKATDKSGALGRAT